MAAIVIASFGGTSPRTDPRKLAPPLGQIARNTKLWSGSLRPYFQPLSINTPSKPGVKNAIYRWGATPGADAQGPIADATAANPVIVRMPAHGLMTGDRIFLTEIGGMPQINNRDFSITVIDADNVALNGENGLGYSDYLSPGTWVQQNGFWFHWNEVVNVVRGPIAGDVTERTYYTGVGLPKVTDSSLSVGMGTDYPLNSFDLGVPKPLAAPSAVPIDVTGTITGASKANPCVILDTAHGRTTGQRVSIAGVGGMTQLNGLTFTVTVITPDAFSIGIDSTAFGTYTSGGTWTQIFAVGDLELRAYVYTYVSQWGEEGPPSAPSAFANVGPAQTVTVGSLSTVPGGSYNIITAKRIYRTVPNGSNTTFHFVSEVTLGTTSTVDAVMPIGLGEALPTDSSGALILNNPPPTDGHSIAQMPNGITVILSKNDVWPSVAFEPHAYPPSFSQSMDYPGVACAVIGQTCIIATQAYPYLLSGSDPETLTLTKVDSQQACSSLRGMVAITGIGAIYPSPDGLVIAGPQGANVVTASYITRSEWNALYNPSSIIAGVWEGRYVAFYDNGVKQAGFIFDPRRPNIYDQSVIRDIGFVDIDDYATACYADPFTDALYLATGNQINRFDGGTLRKTYTWRSRKTRQPVPTNFGFAQVLADSYLNLTFNLYANGTLAFSKGVLSDAPFRLPSGYAAMDYEIELVGTDWVSEIAVGETIDDMEVA